MCFIMKNTYDGKALSDIIIDPRHGEIPKI